MQLQLVLVALTISLDTFAASLAMGTRPLATARFRIALVFALVGGSFPVLGMFLGRLLAGPAAAFAEILSAVVLAGLGGWLLHQARHDPGTGLPDPERSPRGMGLLLLAIGLSADNLLVGLGLGLQNAASVQLGLLTVGFVFVTTLVGLELGKRKRLYLGRWAEALAGLLLIALAGAFLLGWL